MIDLMSVPHQVFISCHLHLFIYKLLDSFAELEITS